MLEVLSDGAGVGLKSCACGRDSTTGSCCQSQDVTIDDRLLATGDQTEVGYVFEIFI